MKTIRSFSEFIYEGAMAVPSDAASDFAAILDKYDGEKEVGNNGGEMVEGFLKKLGLGKGQPWCQAFVYGVFAELAEKRGVPNPVPKTGLVMTHWKQAPASTKIPVKDAIADNTKVKPGQVFIKSRDGGGHIGIVLKVEGDSFISIDGNSSDMVKINKYKIGNMIGFIDYFQDPAFSNTFAQSVSSILSKSTVSIGGGKET
jgi:hypothetical protein